MFDDTVADLPADAQHRLAVELEVGFASGGEHSEFYVVLGRRGFQYLSQGCRFEIFGITPSNQ
jgi:hypothetical protein